MAHLGILTDIDEGDLASYLTTAFGYCLRALQSLAFITPAAE